MSFGVLSCNYKFPSKTLTYGIFVLCIQQNIKLVNEVRSFFTEFILRMRTSCAIRLARNFSIQSKQSDLSKKSDFIGPKTEKSTEKLALDMAESVSVGPTLSLFPPNLSLLDWFFLKHILGHILLLFKILNVFSRFLETWLPDFQPHLILFLFLEA